MTHHIAIALCDSKKITPQISPKNNVVLLFMLIHDQVQYLYSNVLCYRVCVLIQLVLWIFAQAHGYQ